MHMFEALDLAAQGVPVHCTGWAKAFRLFTLPFPPGTYVVRENSETDERGNPVYRWHLPEDWTPPDGFVQQTFTGDKFTPAYLGFIYKWDAGGLPH